MLVLVTVLGLATPAWAFGPGLSTEMHQVEEGSWSLSGLISWFKSALAQPSDPSVGTPSTGSLDITKARTLIDPNGQDNRRAEAPLEAVSDGG